MVDRVVSWSRYGLIKSGLASSEITLLGWKTGSLRFAALVYRAQPLLVGWLAGFVLVPLSFFGGLARIPTYGKRFAGTYKSL